MIVLIFTGGTISMRRQRGSDGVVPTMGGAELVASTPGLADTAPIEIDEWATMAASHFTVGRIWDLRNRVAHHLARPEVDGVVVAQGTDTLEEVAYLVARSISSDKPVVFTGAMRTADDLSWDGPINLVDAVRVAASASAFGQGTLIVLGSRILTALDAVKVEARLPDAFDSPGVGAVGEVDGSQVLFRRNVRRRPVLAPPGLASPVDIVYAYVGCDGRLVDAARAEAVGLVIGALGRGNSNEPFFAAIERWLDTGKPVVVSSRVSRGRLGAVYGFRGGGRDLARAGAIFAGWRRPSHARIDLMLALGAGLSGEALAAVFED